MADIGECSSQNNNGDHGTEEPGSLSVDVSLSEEDNVEDRGHPGAEGCYQVDSVDMFAQIKFEELTEVEAIRYNFPDVSIAYDFFNQYAKAMGFSIRKYKVLRSKADGTLGDILWKSYVCTRHGVRDSKHIDKPDRKREPRHITRCNCKAEFRVCIDSQSKRWFVSMFKDVHNHEFVQIKHVGRLRSHRRMTDADIAEMIRMRKVGISTPKTYASFAQQVGGFGNLSFNKKKMYNELAKERNSLHGDAKAVLTLLRDIASVDPKVCWSHQVDEDGRLRNLIWCDGDCIVDYSVFGDILAFDATYGRNKYKCPVVVFSGINHHMQTVVFACAIVSDETEQTYTWMLEQFLDAMKGKAPKAVITDGDRAMKNAIARVFPAAHHRLCGWHLIRNATTNVSKTAFTKGFSKCMFNDYEVEEFEDRWKKLVSETGVENVQWVNDIYLKKKMWATAYMRGYFFAGIRTTSICEGLHSKIGNYVGSSDSLYEFLQHFQWCLNYMRHNEIEADFKSCDGDPVLQTCLQTLELSAARVYTTAVFILFRDRLNELGCLNVLGSRKTANCVIFHVIKYTVRNIRSEWHVCHYPNEMEWRCPCLGMESFGIPCIHILKTVVHMGIHELPRNLVCKWWTKNCKEGLEQIDSFGHTSNSSNRCIRFAALQHACKRLCTVACRSLEDFHRVRDLVNAETQELLSTNRSSPPAGVNNGMNDGDDVRDPVRVRTKGCGRSVTCRGESSKKPRRCSNCREESHNRRKCPDSQGTQPVGTPTVDDSDDESDNDGEDGSVELESDAEERSIILETLQITQLDYRERALPCFDEKGSLHYQIPQIAVCSASSQPRLPSCKSLANIPLCPLWTPPLRTSVFCFRKKEPSMGCKMHGLS